MDPFSQMKQEYLTLNYSPKWRWLAVDIYGAAKRRGKYSTLPTPPKKHGSRKTRRGSRGVEMGEFSPPPLPPFSEPLPSFFFSYPSNIEVIFDFSDIIMKIHPPFQNPGCALENMSQGDQYLKLLNGTETIFRRELISNNSLSFVLKRGFWVGKK